MTLAPGARLGPYEVTAPIGRGGFGEVYRARDTTLDRDVAVKVLADAFAGDAGRMERFEREAKLLASLNHLNIGAIYGFVEQAGTRALILELVEGPTLAERIAQGPIVPAEALAIARQIAAALEAAHERGIVHRDLKPANIKVKADGTVKVLDFGLAKLAGETPAPDPAESPTATGRATRPGMILGTAGYMSPEQATGQATDKRTDTWAFGCVLYEMLTGKRAFAGESDARILAKIIERDPDFEILPATTPRGIRRLLKRCLRKDPKQRWRDIGDARIEIEEATSGEPAGAGAGATTRGPRMAGWPALALGSLALAALGGLVGWTLAGRSAAPDTVPTRVDMLFPPDQEVVTAVASPAVMSPDGRRIAYVARSQEGLFLYLRSLEDYEPTRVPGSGGASSPFFSPDGRWVAFCANGLIEKAPVAGGEPLPIGACRGILLGASWGADGTIVYSDSTVTGLWQMPADGGTPTALTSPEVPMSEGHRFPYQLPDGAGVLFSTRGPDGQSQLAWLPAGASDWRVVASGDARFTGMKYLANGYLVFGQGSSIDVVPFDLATGRFDGEPRPLITDAASSPVSQYVFFSASDADTLVYVPAEAAEWDSGLAWIGENGETREIARVPGGLNRPRISPDGSQVAVAVRAGSLLDPWIYDLASGRGIRLTRGAEAHYPVWAPDGQSLVVAMNGDLYRLAANGTGSPRLLLQRARDQFPTSWSAGGAAGDRIVFTEVGPNGTTDVLALSTADGEVTPLVATDANERDASLSPGGRWLAYVSDETGRDEVYVQPFLGDGRKARVSLNGGDSPRWSADGSELFFRRGSTILVVPISDADGPGVAKVVVTVPPGVAISDGYDVARDGRRFVAVNNFRDYQTVAASRLRVVFHWLPALERR